MAFWILAALLTLAAALAVVRPFARRAPSPSMAGKAHDIEVYRDQLRELEREVEGGLIGPQEAEQARAEIGRRILKASDDAGAARAGGNGALVRATALAAVLAVPLISWGLYGLIGSPDLPARPLAQRLGQDPSDATVDELIARAEAHLANSPGDARGWQVLAPVYMRLGRFADAETALRNILRLSGDSAELRAALGEAITAGARGIVTSDAEAAFSAALALDPGDPRARFFLALARAQEGRLEDARAAWQKLRSDEPEGSPWREAAGAAIRRAGPPPGPVAPGPTQDDIAAAEGLSQEDRRSMILTMVAGLDDKLRENPADADGWRRLIRSYMVLDRPQEARAALRRGVAALGPETDEGRALAGFARQLGMAIE